MIKLFTQVTPLSGIYVKRGIILRGKLLLYLGKMSQVSEYNNNFAHDCPNDYPASTSAVSASEITDLRAISYMSYKARASRYWLL